MHRSHLARAVPVFDGQSAAGGWVNLYPAATIVGAFEDVAAVAQLEAVIFERVIECFNFHDLRCLGCGLKTHYAITKRENLHNVKYLAQNTLNFFKPGVACGKASE